MFAIDTRRFGRLVLTRIFLISALTVLSWACDDDKPKPCIEPLEYFLPSPEYHCLSTFDQMVNHEKKCQALASDWPDLIARRCIDGFEVEIGYVGMHGYKCFYDIETQKLIGIEVYTDIAQYCDDTSYSVIGGTAVDCGSYATTVLQEYCPYDVTDYDDTGIDGNSWDAGRKQISIDAGRLDGSNGKVDHDDSGSEDET